MQKEIGLRLKMIDEAIGRKVNGELQDVDLTFSQVNLLAILEDQENEQTTQRQLEIFLGVSHPTVVGLVKRLQEKGFVNTSISPDDARMKIVRLTDKGKFIMRGAVLKRQDAERTFTKGFSDQEVKQLGNFLDRILANINE